ncbi:type II secretion system GspH family protein [Halorhodospira sp. 9621]|uniref:type IV pilus modification PilV family protein n=1 Tax=Halorhodospira sp. 9621 TaxID=2899135 RepID=UPI001EE96E72|nr:type II secretion system protein [Halorhodospira sp. 9621]MCG5533388.1 type II secretion system GspH family protein [Halorhodospira sp. 9621]
MNVRKIKSGPKKQSGLTLLETIVAILVLGFAMAGLAAVVPLFQSLDDVDDIDRFARKAQGCAEIVLGCHRATGGAAINSSECNDLSGGPVDPGDFVDKSSCDIESEIDLDTYCVDGGNDLGIDVYCNVVGGNYAEVKISSEEVDGASPIYFGVPVAP